MKRREFIDLYADVVAAGRRRHYPDMRRSEEAFARLDDMTSAARLWRKHRASFAAMTVAECHAKITAKPAAAALFVVPPPSAIQ